MESIITLVVSVIGYFLIVPFPEDAKFLTPDEKALLLARLEEDGGSVHNDAITFRRVLPMIADWKIWIWYFLLSFFLTEQKRKENFCY